MKIRLLSLASLVGLSAAGSVSAAFLLGMDLETGAASRAAGAPVAALLEPWSTVPADATLGAVDPERMQPGLAETLAAAEPAATVSLLGQALPVVPEGTDLGEGAARALMPALWPRVEPAPEARSQGVRWAIAATLGLAAGWWALQRRGTERFALPFSAARRPVGSGS